MLLKAKNVRPLVIAFIAVLLLAALGVWKMWEISAFSYTAREIPQAKVVLKEASMPERHIAAETRERGAENGEILSARDRKNPLRIMNFPVGPKVFATARQLVSDGALLTDHEKVVRFMRFIARFKLRVSQSGDPETVIESRAGTCGEFTNVLLALAATQGIPGRYVNLHNYPPGDGHTVAELFIGGKWRLYDPTYSSYYTDTPEEDRTPNVLSFDELRSGKARNPKVTRIVLNKKRVEEGKPLSLSFLGPEIYEKANPAGPVVEDRAFVYPLALDVESQPSLHEKQFGPKYQGASHIGAAGICSEQLWTFSSLNVGQLYEFQMMPAFVYRERADDSRPFRLVATALSGANVVQGATYTVTNPTVPIRSWKIMFKAAAQQASVLIHHNLCGPDYAYLKAKEFRLREVPRGQGTEGRSISFMHRSK